jgi:class 3 adenylate cyclase
LVKDVSEHWGEREFLEAYVRGMDPVLVTNPAFLEFWVTELRLAASPAAAAALHRIMMDTDIRGVLAAIRVPTLVMHTEGYRDPAQYLSARIPGARVVEIPGRGALTPVGIEVAEEVERFVKSLGEGVEPDRVLTTVLFTDIVGSTEKAGELGDRGWRDLLVAHHGRVRALLAQYRGREVDTAGDGFLVTFDGPARAIRCACAIVDSVRQLGIEVRAGLHTGECELVEDKVRGIAVHIGARVAAQAVPGEVLVSSTVRDLVAGSGILFKDHGSTELKGVPGEWRLYSVARD